MLRAQMQALQNAQVQQALDAKQTKGALDSMGKLLQQLVARDDSRGRSRSRRDDSVRSDRRQPSPDLPNINLPLPTTEKPHAQSRDTPVSGYSQSSRYSKKLSDPSPLDKGQDPTFESWRFQIKNKLRANADHFPTEADRIAFVFGCTKGDAQKHLLPRIEEEAPNRFTVAEELIQLLATVYVNPNKVRDGRYQYNKLFMTTNQSFAEFQTTFLHLAGEGQIHESNLRMDLYDKLSTDLQKGMASHLVDLDTYDKLAARCLSLDTELRRINARVDRQKRLAEGKSRTDTTASKTFTPASTSAPFKSTPFVPRVSASPEPTRQATPGLTSSSVTCYNCKKPGHFSRDCPEPRRADLKEIKEDEDEGTLESGKDYA
jgi:hypothetical protein